MKTYRSEFVRRFIQKEDRMGKFTTQLKAAQKAWDQAGDGDFPEVPPGQYKVQVQSAEVKTTQKGGLRASLRYLIVDGEHAGENLFDGCMIDPEKPNVLGILKRLIRAIGYDAPTDLSDLEDVLEKIAQDQPTLMVQVTKDKQYTNCKVLERLGDSPPTEEGAEGAEAEEAPGGEEGEAIGLGDQVNFDNEGDDVQGQVSKLNEDDTADVDNEDGTYENVPIGKLTVVAKAGGNEAEGSEVDADLLAFAEAHNVKLPKDPDTEAILKALNAPSQFWYASKLTDDEQALLALHSVRIIAGQKKSPAKPAAKPAAKKPVPAKKGKK
jgi:hypothetical protein